MTTSQLFFESALINLTLFLWLASAVTTVRIMLKAQKQASVAVLCGVLLGPVGLLGSWLIVAPSGLMAKHADERDAQRWRSPVAILCTTLLVVGLFYAWFLGLKSQNLSVEATVSQIWFVVVGLGMAGGLTQAFFSRRVAFFESCWTAFLCAAFVLMLRDWADNTFVYGTSSTYFVTLLITSSSLFLIFLALGGSIGYLFLGEGRLNTRVGYESFIGLRFLMTKRSSHVVSLITVISVVAVMIACSGMIVVMSVMNGFSSDLRSKILGANAHLMVLRYGDFTEYREVVDKTKNIEGVAGANPFVLSGGMVTSNKNFSEAIITGLDVGAAQQIVQLHQYVAPEAFAYLQNPETIPVTTEGQGRLLDDQPALKENPKNDLPGVIIGKQMASDLAVFVGDVVNLVSPAGGGIGPMGPMPRAKPFRVAGLFASGMYEYDAKFSYIRLSDAQDFFNLDGAVTGVEYRLLDIEQTRVVAKKIEAEIGGYPFYTRDWMQMNRNMFSALQLEKIAMLVILGTLIFMACLLILVALIMVVMEKGKEIAILKSMGATDASIMKIFVTYGLFVGGWGAILGGALGLGLCLVIEKVGIPFDPDIYYFSNLPVKIVSGEVTLVVISAILVSFLATIPPALFAARLKPVEGLRYE
jgi:ABC-type lipoprotein release transport system permease subunit